MVVLCDTSRCSGCKKDIKQGATDFFICVCVYGRYENFTCTQIAACVNCLQKIPESLREPQAYIKNGADVVNICIPEWTENKVKAKPLHSVHKNVVKFCASSIANEFWPEPKRV